MNIRFHVNPHTGNPGVCRAKIQCRWGASSEEHYSTPEEAREAYEAGRSPLLKTKKGEKGASPQDHEASPEAQAFARGILKGLPYLQEVPGGFSFPQKAKVTTKTTDPARWIRLQAQGALEKPLGYRPDEETITVAARGLELPQEPLSSGVFWEKYHEGLQQALRAKEPQEASSLGEPSPREALGDPWEAHSPRGEVGSKEEAHRLLKTLEEVPQEDLKEAFEEGEPPAGFRYLGAGYEAVALQSEASGAIYKVSRWHSDGGSQEYTLSALAAQEAFPQVPGVTQGRTSGYFLGGRGIVAQEPAEGSLTREAPLSKEQYLRLAMSGHSDLQAGNYAVKPSGEVSCFDTFGETYEDLDTYVPPGAKRSFP